MNKNNQLQHIIRDLISGRLHQNFEEQVGEASKAVAEIDTINSPKAFLKVKERIQKGRKFTLLFNTFSRAAAILFIPLLVVSGVLIYRQLNVMNNQQFAIQEITSPPGVRSQVVLPDGSKVWLNAQSTIKFKVPFDQTNRDVLLSGEAFFAVQKNPNAPFVVKTGNVSVTVLGTKFNCKAFEDEGNIEVVLAEGKVIMNTNSGISGKEIIMKPGERAVFDKRSNFTRVTNEKIDKYIAWHNGKLVFDETPMPEVATQLERWFGIEVIIDDPKILKYRITTTFENESLNQVLDLLKLSSPIEIKYVVAAIDKTSQTQTNSKIIISRKIKN
jgi:transmembrane sensor